MNSWPGSIGPFSKVQKNGQQKTCNLFCNIAAKRVEQRCCAFYYPHRIKPVLQQIRLLIGLNMRGKTRNIAIQRVLQQCQLQCCKTSCTFFLARSRRETSVSIRKKYRLEPGVVNSLPLRENSRERFILKPKFSCCCFNKKISSSFFISRSRSLSPFFSLSSASLPPTFSFSLFFSSFIFQICGHDN